MFQKSTFKCPEDVRGEQEIRSWCPTVKCLRRSPCVKRKGLLVAGVQGSSHWSWHSSKVSESRPDVILRNGLH